MEVHVGFCCTTTWKPINCLRRKLTASRWTWLLGLTNASVYHGQASTWGSRQMQLVSVTRKHTKDIAMFVAVSIFIIIFGAPSIRITTFRKRMASFTLNTSTRMSVRMLLFSYQELSLYFWTESLIVGVRSRIFGKGIFFFFFVGGIKHQEHSSTDFVPYWKWFSLWSNLNRCRLWLALFNFTFYFHRW